MDIQKRVLSILKGAIVGRIKFAFVVGERTVTVDRQAFLEVARAIDKKNVTIYLVPPSAAEAGAQYWQRTNEIQIGQIKGRQEEAALAHEALHAYFDLMKIDMHAHDEEAAAYVVSTLYLLMSGVKKARIIEGAATTAITIAEFLLAEYKKNAKKVPVVSRKDWEDLIVSVAADPLYSQHKTYIHNG